MYVKYQAVLRAEGECRVSTKQTLQQKCVNLCGANRYVATLHAINNSVIKLGRLSSSISKQLFRGINDGMLPEAFFEEKDGIQGGVEFGFMSFTTNEEQALEYATQEGKKGEKSNQQAYRCTLFRMHQGMADRGAEISWLSQYPDEAEILFPPFTGLQVFTRKYRNLNEDGNIHEENKMITEVKGAVLLMDVRPTVPRWHRNSERQTQSWFLKLGR